MDTTTMRAHARAWAQGGSSSEELAVAGIDLSVPAVRVEFDSIVREEDAAIRRAYEDDAAARDRAAADQVQRFRAVLAAAPARTTVRVRVGQREVTCRVTPRHVDASPHHMPATLAEYDETVCEIALDRAIQRLYGRNACWHADSGVRGFGQVFRSVAARDGGGASAVTGLVRLEVEVVS